MDYAREAEKLAPYLLKYFRQSQQQIAAPSSSGMIQHDIGGSWHTGTLDNDQAPQFLLADGSRPLTGNLSVNANVLIDGVDISAHAANPSAHHAPVTAGTLISVSGQQVSLAPGSAQYQVPVTGASPFAPAWTALAAFAGAGLSFSGGQFAVGVANTGAAGLSVEADAIRLTTSSNPGAAASVLSTDANGYLQLRRLGLGTAPTNPLSVAGDANISGNAAIGSLSVSGAATVGQDFTVGANVLYVNQAGTRVGINRAPDQQFDLDVAGAIRGQYIVGKHAVQLASAVGVWHFDGAAPYNLDYTGSDASHVGLGGTVSGGVIYRPGRYGKAVQVAESTTNYCTDPSSEGASAWVAQYNGSGYLSGSQSTDYALYGERSYKIAATQATWTGAYNAPHYQVAAAAAWNSGETNTISCYVRGTGTWRIVFEDSGQNLRDTQSVTLTDVWQRVVVSATNTFGANYGETRVAVFSESAGTIYIDGVQIERRAYATPYCDGSLGSGHSWSGTAHASASSRATANVTYSLNAKQSNRWTIMCWRKLDAFPANTVSWSLRWNNSAVPNRQLLLAYRNNENIWRWYASVEDSGGTLREGYVEYSSVSNWTGWHHLAMTIDVTTGAIVAYLDGVAIGSATLPSTNGWYNNAWDALYLYYSGAASGLIDELVVLDYVADAKLIRAIYESDAPVFVESSVFHWRSPSRVPIWVDEFGLWARGVSGNEILGLYGGDPRNPSGNVQRSWGGVTMEENDIVIGRAAQAAVHWDDSVGSLMIGRSSASNLLLSSGQAQMRDGTTVWGSWSNSGLTVGRVANSTSRLEITSSGNINIINRNSSGVDTTAISLSSGGSASFTGSITATSGSISGVLTIGTSGEIRQGTGTLGTDFTGLRVLQSSSIGQIAIYDNNIKTMRISSDDVRYKMASDFTGIRTIKWLEDTDYSGSWSDLSSANGNYAYIGAYYTSTNSYLYLSSRVNNTGSPANTRYSAIWLVPSRNESSTIYSNSLALYTFNATYSYEGAAIFTGMYLDLGAVSTPTRPLAQSSNAQVYIKGGNLVVRYNDGGTHRYKYLNLAGTGTTWTHTTTPP